MNRAASGVRRRGCASFPWALTAGLLLCGTALAQSTTEGVQAGGARASTNVRAAATATEAWLGEKLVITVELRSPTFFADSPVFYLPRVSGAVLMKPTESPVLQTQVIEGKEYAIQRHEILLFAQRPGPIDVPPIRVRFAIEAEPPLEIEEETPAFRITARTPPGTENLDSVITTSSLTVSEDAVTSPGKIRVGDAFTRRITVQALDVPGMLLPPLRVDPPAGIRAYPREPLVSDRYVRGQMTGERIEEISYLGERPGHFTLPEQRIHWWNPETRELREAILPAIRFQVTRSAADAGRIALWTALLLGSPLWLAWYRRDALAGTWKRWKVWANHLEPVQFRRLLRACEANDASDARRALLNWRQSLEPTRQAALMSASASLADCVARLDEALYGRHARTDWSGASLATQLRKARLALRSRDPAVHGRDRGLPELNPALPRE